MRVRVDRELDALYIRLNENPILESEEVQPGVVLDFDESGMVVGIEMLQISKRMPPEEMQTLHLATS